MEMATIPFRALLFLPKGRQGAKASAGREPCGFRELSLRHLTLLRQRGSDVQAAGPANNQAYSHLPVGAPPAVISLMGNANYSCSCFQQEGSNKPTCMAGHTGALGSWGKGYSVRQGRLHFQTLLLPHNAAGRETERQRRLGTAWCWRAAGCLPPLCSLHGFSKAAQPAAPPAASHPDLPGWPAKAHQR